MRLNARSGSFGYNCAFEGKVQVGHDQEMTQSERNSHSKNRGVKKLN